METSEPPRLTRPAGLTRPLVIAAIVAALLIGVLIGGVAGLSKLVFGSGPNPETIASSSLESMRAQNRLVAFIARYVSVTSSRQSRFGFSAERTLILPGDVRLSEEPHVTIIGGESRDFIYPDRYPYTAICKLELSHLPDGATTWVQKGHATGYLVGRKTLMTSGHVQLPEGGRIRIRVIPACWANQPVFGRGLITWVKQTFWWHSDSGSDLQVCELYDPIGDQLGYFGFRHYNSDWEDLSVFSMAGFHYDMSVYAMSGESGIAVRDDDDGDDIEVNGDTYDTTQVESDADEASGSSGSPLFAWWPDGVYAIGVHSGTQYDGTASGTEILSCAAGGDGFVAAAGWGRDMWG